LVNFSGQEKRPIGPKIKVSLHIVDIYEYNYVSAGTNLTKNSNIKDLLVLCNGPSIKALVDWGFHNIPEQIETVGTSLAFRFFRDINWWPTYYALGDPKVLLHHQAAFQALIADPDIPIKKFYLCTQLPHLDIDISFFDPFDRVVKMPWQVTGQMAFKVGFEQQATSIFLLGCDNGYYWDHSLVKPISSDLKQDNRAVVIEDVVDNPNYGIPNYLRKGDVTSWLFNHPDKSVTSASGNHIWQELMDTALERNINVIDFSEGNLPAKIKRNDFRTFFSSYSVECEEELFA
jgi:hypothetical protein